MPNSCGNILNKVDIRTKDEEKIVMQRLMSEKETILLGKMVPYLKKFNKNTRYRRNGG